MISQIMLQILQIFLRKLYKLICVTNHIKEKNNSSMYLFNIMLLKWYQIHLYLWKFVSLLKKNSLVFIIFLINNYLVKLI